MDLILCRNVLIYMGAAQIGRLVSRFHRALAPGGWLLVGATETALIAGHGFSTVNYRGMTAHRKAGDWQEVPRPMADTGTYESSAPPAIGLEWPVANLRAEKGAEALSRPTPPSSEIPAQPPDALAEARELFEQGRYGEVVERLTRVAAQAPAQADALALLSRACANQGELDAALLWIIKAITADKLNPQLHFLRGTVLHELGNDGEAALSFTRSLYLDPDFVMAHAALGHLARRAGNPAQASRHFDRALQLLHGRNPDEPIAESEGMTAGRMAEILKAFGDPKLQTTEAT
jgi:chemotaxis protein methyltransferase CheR